MADSFGLDSYVANTAYAIDGEMSGPRYPWIQADSYQPKNAKAKINIGITTDSMALVDGQVLSDVVDMATSSFDDDGTEVEFGVFKKGVRWVILSRPKVMAMVKATGEIIPTLAKGMKARGEVTVCRVLLACLIGDELVKDASGDVQIFTLKLKSSKTAMVGSSGDKDLGIERNGGHRTIELLNSILVKRAEAKPGQWLGHTVSVEIGAVAEKFANADGDSSIGIRFVFPEGSTAKAMPTEAVAEVFKLVSSEDFKALAKNPFKPVAPVLESVTIDYGDGEMPF
jgi:hypothetical protein